MEIGGFQKLTLIDYPGKIACTIFLIGCNFRCPFCYNPELVLPEKIKKQPRIQEKEILTFLKEKKGLLEGVCITGGEPTIHRDLPVLIRKIKKLGYSVKLDTNGSNPKMLENLIKKKLVDYLAMDIKAPFQIGPKRKAAKYEKATGVKININNIKKSVDLIKNSGIDYEFRTTIVPGLHLKGDIVQLARSISSVKRFYLQGFQPGKNINKRYEKIRPYPQEYLLEIQRAVAFLSDVCRVR